VIGAKKGFPNFNEFLLQTSVQVTRRLQAFKPDLKKPNVFFQQSYEIGISNYLALEAWNSYTQAFPRALDVLVTNRVWLSLSNASAPVVSTVTSNSFLTTSNFTIANNLWAGKEFRVPMSNTVALVPDWEFHFQKPYLRVPRDNVTFDPINLGFPVPDWKLYVTNRLQFILIDKASGRIVDYVNFDRMMGGMDITRALAGETNLFGDPGLQPGAFWLTNHLGNVANAMTWGITNQIYVSTNNVLARADWTSYTDNPIDGKSKEKAVDDFRKFLGLPPLFDLTNTNPPTGNTVQVPFTPTRKLDQQLSWQVNDPLVHYTMEDLYDPFYADTNAVQALKPGQRAETNNIGQPNDRSRPWGGKSTKDPSSNPLAYDLAIKDPLIANSDDWDFPTNKFPNIGWLGRVHRGTPWQTVYLKSSVEPTNSWGKWAGRFDTHPTNDWHLVGLFTTAPNDNAARGLLSVNQTNSAAWSAVLGGVSVLTNTVPGNPNTQLAPTYASMLIEPVSPQLNYIVTNINAARLQQPGQVFRDLGSVLASTNLTTGSPFLNLSSDPQNKRSVSDEVYERIPQQILSLLKEDEPFLVIYSFGQSLRPAADSIVRTPGVYRNLCTNYQVTGEVVTKTAVRIDEIPQPPKQPLRYKAVVESYSILPSD